LSNNNIPVKTPSNDSSQEDYKHEVQLKLKPLLERRYQNQAAPLQSANALAQAEALAQAQQNWMTIQNIPFQSSETIPPQDSSHQIHQIQTSTIPVQQSQQEVSMTPPEVPEGWKAQWNGQYEEW
jgi:hypothetical protein